MLRSLIAFCLSRRLLVMVAFVAFLVTAIIASQLSGRAKQRDVAAAARQRDLERLYALSRALLLSERGASTPGASRRSTGREFKGAGYRWADSVKLGPATDGGCIDEIWR